jgi:hypothetical protein
MKRCLCLLAFVGVCLVAGLASAEEKLMVYTSMKESMFSELRDAFVAKNIVLSIFGRY